MRLIGLRFKINSYRILVGLLVRLSSILTVHWMTVAVAVAVEAR